MDNIGEKLSEYFKNQGITQENLADKLGVSSAYINALFNGKKHFGKNSAQKWSNLFGLDAGWLLTGNGEMLVSNISQNGNNNTAVSGNGNQVNSQTIDKAFEEISAQRKLTEKSQEQIDRLLSIIENMSK